MPHTERKVWVMTQAHTVPMNGGFRHSYSRVNKGILDSTRGHKSVLSVVKCGKAMIRILEGIGVNRKDV